MPHVIAMFEHSLSTFNSGIYKVIWDNKFLSDHDTDHVPVTFFSTGVY